jgi:hypothetical protein
MVESGLVAPNGNKLNNAVDECLEKFKAPPEAVDVSLKSSDVTQAPANLDGPAGGTDNNNNNNNNNTAIDEPEPAIDEFIYAKLNKNPGDYKADESVTPTLAFNRSVAEHPRQRP